MRKYNITESQLFGMIREAVKTSLEQVENVPVEEQQRTFELASKFRKTFLQAHDHIEHLSGMPGLKGCILRVGKVRIATRSRMVFNMIVRRELFNTVIRDRLERAMGVLFPFVRIIDGGDLDGGANIAVTFDPEEMAKTRMTQFKKRWIDDPGSDNPRFSAPGHTIDEY